MNSLNWYMFFRELAYQIAEQFRVLGKAMNLSECVVVGGRDFTSQTLALSRRPHVVIATPGRLADVLRTGSIEVNLKRLRFLVLDEADRLFDASFAEDVQLIYSHLGNQRQTLLFSATLTPLVTEQTVLPLQDPMIFSANEAYVPCT